MSNETGTPEIYVRDFPDCIRKWQVSQGGVLPQWRRDGRELFYLAPDGVLMGVDVSKGSILEFASPENLFPTGLRLLNLFVNQYAVANDGQRFLINLPLKKGQPDAITAVIPR
jgi:hypothetical protein